MKRKKREAKQYAKFERAVDDVLKFSHAEMKDKLEEEKKRKESKKSSASREEDAQA